MQKVLCVLLLSCRLMVNTSSISMGERRDLRSSWGGWAGLFPVATTTEGSWAMDKRIPMTGVVQRLDPEDLIEESRKKKGYKKYKKYLLPLLLAYKLKFFTLIPVIIGGLVLLTGATGMAGFFFALFAATMGLKGGGGDH